MTTLQSGDVRELLRAVPYPGFSRDIVSAGFVKDITDEGGGIVVHFSPNSSNTDKVRQMEEGIRDALSRAKIANFKIATSLPFGEDEMALRKPIEAEDDSDFEIDQAMTGAGKINPLQAELMQDGIAAEADLLRDDLSGRSRGEGIGFGDNEPMPFEGPAGPAGDSYDGALPVFQWDIDPHDPAAESAETGVRIDDWEIRIWWQAHPTQDLLYASLQAMRDDWADHVGSARQHPVGRSAAVNLVFDRRREAVVAIYGTVRDFRPFVEAFRQALAEQTNTTPESGSQESES